MPVVVFLAILAGTSWPTPPAMPNNSDKVVHVVAYACLGTAVVWAARGRGWRGLMGWLALVAALAAADEWHQQFIPGRRMDRRDWVADTVGAVIGISLFASRERRRELVA